MVFTKNKKLKYMNFEYLKSCIIVNVFEIYVFKQKHDKFSIKKTPTYGM